MKSVNVILQRLLLKHRIRKLNMLRQLFRAKKSKKEANKKEAAPENGGGGGGGVAAAAAVKSSPISPLRSRFVMRSHRDSVSPAIPNHLSASNLIIQGITNKAIRAKRLMKEFHEIERLQDANKNDPLFTVELVDDNLFDWHVKLYKVDTESKLYSDMQELSINHILLQITFPDDFPFGPPFMRVVSPRIERGYVLEGGAICMELLTPRGWASAYTVEALIMQFAASVVKGHGGIQRKVTKGQKSFSRRTAEESFRFLVKTHEKYGWVTPNLSDG